VPGEKKQGCGSMALSWRERPRTSYVSFFSIGTSWASRLGGQFYFLRINEGRLINGKW
jgi:hypothetical protein